MNYSEYIDSLRGKRIAVLGLGISNKPLVECLAAQGLDVTVFGKPLREDMPEYAEHLEALGVKLKPEQDYLADLDQDIMFRPQRIMPFDPRLEAAKARGSVVTSEMEAFLSLCPCRVIGVTGSDGKATHLSDSIGRDIFVCRQCPDGKECAPGLFGGGHSRRS